jgi:hypothetical protein
MFEGWPFVSREERERRQKEYADRVFPFGVDAQRERTAAVLRELFGGEKKYDAQDALFCFISAKAAYAQAGEGGDGYAKAGAQLRKLRFKQPDKIALMLAFIELESNIASLDDYPTADDVRRRAALSS